MKRSTIKTSLFAFFSRARIDLVGQLFGSEVIAFIFFPYSKISETLKKYPLLKKITLGYVILLLSLAFSDIAINNSQPEDYLRGWASIVFSYISVVFLCYNLGRSSSNIYYYLFFGAISYFLFGREITNEVLTSEHTNTFKVYFMGGTNLLVLLFASLYYKVNKKSVLVIFVLYALISLFLDARSNGVIFFISSLLVFVKVRNIKLTRSRILGMSVILLLILSVSYVFYIESVLSGKLTGDNTKQILRLENPYNPISLLAAGRNEFAVTVTAIQDNVVWGFGSWAKDPTGVYSKIWELQSNTQNRIRMENIPTHSIMLTAWLWAGIGGLIAIFYIFILSLKRVWILFRRSLVSAPLLILLPLTIEALWDFFFSPFGHMRMTVPLFIAYAIVEYYNMLKNESAK